MKTEHQLNVFRNTEDERQHEQSYVQNRTERFTQFSDVIRREASRRAEIFHHGVVQYRRGEITPEEYQGIIDENEALRESMIEKVKGNSMAVSSDNAAYQKAVAHIESSLAPLPHIEAGERLNHLWTGLEKNLIPFAKAYAQIQELLRRGRVTPEDLKDAWSEKRDAYERMCECVFKLTGLSSVEAAELEERARGVIRPDEPLPSVEAESSASLMSHEEYDEELRVVMKHVVDLDDIADSFEREGKMTNDAKKELQDQLRTYSADIVELDEKTAHPQSSKERRALLGLMEKLRYRLADPYYVSPHQARIRERPLAKAASVGDARAAYARVVAAYTSIQHTLDVEQRRRVRAEFAGLSSLMRRAELAADIAHATEHAPAVAHASLASVPKAVPTVPVPQRRGLSALLGDVFRLK